MSKPHLSLYTLQKSVENRSKVLMTC